MYTTLSHWMLDDKKRERGVERHRGSVRERGEGVGVGLLLPWCYAAVAPVMLLQLLLGNSDGCCHVD